MAFFLLSLLLAPAFAQTETYCQSGPTTTVDGNLGYTAFFGDTKNLSDASDCPGYIGPKDLTNLWADIRTNGTYTLVYNVTTCGNPFPTVSGAWIDFDQNGSFDPTEALFPFNNSFGLLTVTFKINPTSPIKNGMTRMRVQVQETSSINPLDPCVRFAYGGTKDFNISISSRCNSGPTTTVDANLGPVALKGNTLTISDATDCPGQIGPIDLTSQVADLSPGANYILNFTVTTCGDLYETVTTAWIDYNNNRVLEDWERIIPYSTKNGFNSVGFRVATSGPNQTVVTGNVWMRIQTQETNAGTIFPCTLFPYGGTKDLTIQLGGSYCTSGPTTAGGIALGAVYLQGATTKINETSGCPGAAGPQLFLDQSADLVQLSAWSISWSVVNCGNSYAFETAAWIDFNQDGMFDLWEQVTGTSTSPTNTYSFKVPPSTPDQQVKEGVTRLRVQVQADATGTLNPCNTLFTHGGTKDFNVVIHTTSSERAKTSSLKKQR